MAYGKLEVRVNVGPATGGGKDIVREEREIARRIKEGAKRMGFTGTIDVDYIPDEPKINIDIFDERGNRLKGLNSDWGWFWLPQGTRANGFSRGLTNDEMAEIISEMKDRIVSETLSRLKGHGPMHVRE